MSSPKNAWVVNRLSQPALEVSTASEGPEYFPQHVYPQAIPQAMPQPDPQTAYSQHGPTSFSTHDYTPTPDMKGPAVVDERRKPEGPKRILGLSIRAFWIVVAIMVLVFAAAIAGGVAGGLAASKSSHNDDPKSIQTVTMCPTTTTPTSTSDTTSTFPSATAPLSAEASPAPTDGGCPKINGTSFTPFNSTGGHITVQGQTDAQSFEQVCDTNWPADAGNGNPDVQDLLTVFMPTLKDCIGLCAQYNVAHKLAKGDESGYCRSVVILKDVGGNCYLKNQVGQTNETFGFPKAYSAAMLVAGLDL